MQHPLSHVPRGIAPTGDPQRHPLFHLILKTIERERGGEREGEREGGGERERNQTGTTVNDPTLKTSSTSTAEEKKKKKRRKEIDTPASDNTGLSLERTVASEDKRTCNARTAFTHTLSPRSPRCSSLSARAARMGEWAKRSGRRGVEECVKMPLGRKWPARVKYWERGRGR